MYSTDIYVLRSNKNVAGFATDISNIHVLFHKPSKAYYQIKDGWGIQKQGSKIHTFNYEVSPNNGLVDRVFGDALNILATAVTAAFTAADVVKAENDLKAYLPVSEADDEAKIQARKDIVDIIDTETGPTREKLAHLIHTAYTYIVETKPDDLVSYVSLADKALMTLSTDVKLLLGMRSNIPGVALAMVVETVATGSAAALKRRSIKPLVETNTVEKPSKIAQMKDLYTKKIYVSLKPKVQLEAEMDAAQIYPAPGETWAVQLLGQASNMEQLRGLDFATVEKAVESAPAIDQEKIYEMFAGLRGGGESSDVRRNLVQGGVDIKLAFELEKKAKEVRFVAIIFCISKKSYSLKTILLPFSILEPRQSRRHSRKGNLE